MVVKDVVVVFLVYLPTSIVGRSCKLSPQTETSGERSYTEWKNKSSAWQSQNTRKKRKHRTPGAWPPPRNSPSSPIQAPTPMHWRRQSQHRYQPLQYRRRTTQEQIVEDSRKGIRAFAPRVIKSKPKPHVKKPQKKKFVSDEVTTKDWMDPNVHPCSSISPKSAPHLPTDHWHVQNAKPPTVKPTVTARGCPIWNLTQRCHHSTAHPLSSQPGTCVQTSCQLPRIMSFKWTCTCMTLHRSSRQRTFTYVPGWDERGCAVMCCHLMHFDFIRAGTTTTNTLHVEQHTPHVKHLPLTKTSTTLLTTNSYNTIYFQQIKTTTTTTFTTID